MRDVLVTGGAGFIGSHLCRLLLEKGQNVICVDNLLTGNIKNIEDLRGNERFTFLQQDVIQSLPATLSAQAVFHLASPASPNHHSKLSYLAHPMETMLVNTLGTLQLLRFAKKNNASFLFASTSEVYGDPLEHPQKEEYRGNVSTTGSRSVYDEAKRFGETLTAHFVRSEGVDGRIGRIFNTYGPAMAAEDLRMIIVFITHAIQNKPIPIFGDGSQTRSLNYVSDTVEGLYRLMFSKKTKGEIVNIGSEEEHTVREYAMLVKRLTNSSSEIVAAEPLPDDDPKQRRPDITKAKLLLNWQPSVSLEEGLKKTIEYFKSL